MPKSRPKFTTSARGRAARPRTCCNPSATPANSSGSSRSAAASAPRRKPSTSKQTSIVASTSNSSVGVTALDLQQAAAPAFIPPLSPATRPRDQISQSLPSQPQHLVTGSNFTNVYQQPHLVSTNTEVSCQFPPDRLCTHPLADPGASAPPAHWSVAYPGPNQTYQMMSEVPASRPEGPPVSGTPPLQTVAAGIPAPFPVQIQSVVSNNGSGNVVWIVGSSIIKRAETYVKTRPMGRHLGLRGCSVTWAGHSGLRYTRVLNITNSLRQCIPPPNFMIVHFGGNDLGTENCGLLRKNMKDVLWGLMQLFPHACIVWSSILPRLAWRYSWSNKAMEKTRARINRAMIYYTIQQGHKAIKHPDFNDELEGLFLSDGVHLSPVGNEISLSTLQSALESFFTSPTQIYPAS